MLLNDTSYVKIANCKFFPDIQFRAAFQSKKNQNPDLKIQNLTHDLKIMYVFGVLQNQFHKSIF